MKTMIRRCLATLSTTILALSVAAQDLGPGARPVGENWSRSPVMAVNGMAATAQPLASSIAVDVLKQGGSAVDAAIAANAALGLMEPTGNGIGGDLFAIVWDPKSKQLYGYNGSGRSPKGRSLAQLKSAIAAETKGSAGRGLRRYTLARIFVCDSARCCRWLVCTARALGAINDGRSSRTTHTLRE